MVRAAIIQFREMGLEPVIYRHATHAVNKRGTARIGFTGGNPNPQFDYDHRQDQALFMDSDFCNSANCAPCRMPMRRIRIRRLSTEEMAVR